MWPESYEIQPRNAHVKDALENRLHTLACTSRITQAKQAITGIWEAACLQHVGALPGGMKAGTPPTALPAPTPASIPATPPASARPSGPEGNVAPSAGQCPASAPIKGNIASGKFYHQSQGDCNYAHTRAEPYFRIPEAAQAAGFRSAGVASRVRSTRSAAR